jgi:hypothetical protein
MPPSREPEGQLRLEVPKSYAIVAFAFVNQPNLKETKIMPITWTSVLQNRSGVFNEVVADPRSLNENSHVLVSISELTRPVAGEPAVPFIGSARMTIGNIAPMTGGRVNVNIFIDWPEPLVCKLWLTLMD